MAFQVNYSALDRLLHRIVFSTPSVQIIAADVENRVLGSVFASTQAARPIFITSLPRAGTTLLLEVLNQFPSLASQSYRDMPFVMAPLLWSRVSSTFRKRAELNERAHGDGMQIGYDSPEAFEEIIWQAFWPEKYSKIGIDLWERIDSKSEAENHFVEHMKKIVALRRPDRVHDGRYISKNNANMARLDFIQHMLPDAKIVVPIRHPVAHAASLHRQHHNFIEMHKNEPFARRYMADLGHYEFGDLHRPIAFPRLDTLISSRHPSTINYWLSYWIAAFEHVLLHRNKVTLVSYEAACTDGRKAVTELCARLEIAEDGMLEAAAGLFKAPSSQHVDEAGLDPELREHAEELHTVLTSDAI